MKPEVACLVVEQRLVDHRRITAVVSTAWDVI
jgi:hypothetical protein